MGRQQLDTGLVDTGLVGTDTGLVGTVVDAWLRI
jgi:hypothetical protein